HAGAEEPSAARPRSGRGQLTSQYGVGSSGSSRTRRTIGPTHARCTTYAAGSSWRPSAADLADLGTSADREITLTGRWAAPTHSSVSPAPTTTLTSVLPNHSRTTAATGSNTANDTQFGSGRTPMFTSYAISPASPRAGGHHHQGTRNRSR